jgi:hypothetical protein
MNRDLVLTALGASPAAAGELPLVAVGGRPVTVTTGWSDLACDVAARRGSGLVVVDDPAGPAVAPRPGAGSPRPWPVVAITTSPWSARRADLGLLVGRSGPSDHDGLDEATAVTFTERFLDRCSDGPAASARPGPSLTELVPFPPDQPYDLPAVVAAVVDDGSWVEFDGRGAREVLTAVARLGGRSVGVVACRPSDGRGALGPAAAARIDRLVRWCEGGGRPLVSFVDTDGTRDAADGDDVRAVLAAATAVRSSAVTKLAVVVGGAVGRAAVLTAAVGGRADLVLPWPRARFGRTPLRATGAAAGTGADDAVREADLLDIVHPDDTRSRLIEALELLRGAREYAR